MSDDDKEKKRPNAKYNLSHEKVQGAEVVYHYNRERRLEKAPQAVQNLYEEKTRRRFSFFGVITRSKPNAMLFGTIIFLCALMLLISYFGLAGDSRELDGNILSVKGKKYEGTVIIEVNKTLRKDKASRRITPYTGAVNVAVFPPAKTGKEQTRQPTSSRPPIESRQPADIFLHRIFFTSEQDEHFLFTVPYQENELALIFQTEKKSVNMTIKIGD